MKKLLSTVFSAVRRKIGLFWRFLFAMFIASLFGTLMFVWGGNLYDNSYLMERLAPGKLNDELAKKFDSIAPALEATNGNPLLCGIVLKVWGRDEFESRILSEGGPNTLTSLITRERIQFRYTVNGRPACQYPEAPALAQPGDRPEVIRAEAQHVSASGARQAMELVIQPFRSWELIWVASLDFPWLLIPIFIIVLNLCSALTLAPMLVRRIKRAEKVARGWTEGSMQARIADTRSDEFGNLVRSFNHLADSFVEVITMKQELAAMEERNRLARELHDTAKQRAFALNLQLTALGSVRQNDPHEANRMAQSALTLVQHLQSDLSNVIKRLTASTIAEVGIRQVFCHEIGGLFEGTGIRWNIDIPDDVDAVLRGVPHLAQQIFLIGIEASANVLKHASARSLNLRLAEDSDHYVLSIEDDGVGMHDAGGDSLGMGIANMRLRARDLPNGSFSLLNKDAGGVLVTVYFEL